MRAIFKIYTGAHNILKLANILPSVSVTTRELIITTKNGKCELTDELSTNARLQKILKLHGNIVW